MTRWKNLRLFAASVLVGGALAWSSIASANFRTFRWPAAFSDDSWLPRWTISYLFVSYEDKFAVSTGSNAGMRACYKYSYDDFSFYCSAWNYLPSSAGVPKAARWYLPSSAMPYLANYALPYFEWLRVSDMASAGSVRLAVLEVGN